MQPVLWSTPVAKSGEEFGRQAAIRRDGESATFRDKLKSELLHDERLDSAKNLERRAATDVHPKPSMFTSGNVALINSSYLSH